MSRPGVLGRPGVTRLLSETGDWMLFIALPVFVLQLTGSTLVTATVFVLELVPTVLLGPLAGALVDRWHPWRLMTSVVVAQAMMLLPLLLVRSAEQLWIVYLVVLVESVLGTVVEPARSTTAARLVTSDDLPSVNQLFGVLSSAARLVGGPIGGLLLGLTGLPGVLIGDAATFLGAAALLVTGWRSRTGAPATLPPTSLVRDWAEGLRIVARSRVLRRSLVVTGLMGLAQGCFVVLFVFFVVRDLGGDAADVGVLRGVQAIGAIVGGILLGRVVRRISAERLVGHALLFFGVLSLATWNAPLVTTAFGVYVGLFITAGAPAIAGLTGLLTVLQRSAPEHATGRVLSAFFAVSGGFQAAGMLIAGLVGTGVGLTIALQVQGCLYLTAGLLAFRLRGLVGAHS
ncbi:MFS transporter [Nakamurella sp. A5-74]|uniref:MFS transporter n=1 Tax=Nakamurella sp. A5-74 TaxID=3158264 RepID=A0AAU8DSK8_9ACTN